MSGYLKKTLLCISLSTLLVQGSYALPDSYTSVTSTTLPDFVTLFKNISPAVVNISTMVTPKSAAHRYGIELDQIPAPLRRYFSIPLPQDNNGRPQLMSLGSGFITSEDGYILTNHHVINGADKIVVRFHDRSELEATVIGSDVRSDLALLKVETAKPLPKVTFGASDSLKPGQWVAAIGSPFNFDYSITKGIVSAVQRSLPSDAYVPFIQADVPVNPGNSGGPLLNLNGEVVGINSQIFTRSGGFMGLSFAIPSDHAQWAVQQLKEHGYVARGWLGIIIQEVDRDLAESFGLDRSQGALVSQVAPEGPAAQAGLVPGDIIIAVDDQIIKESSMLPMLVGVVKPGDSIDLTFIRQGKRQKKPVTVGTLADDKAKFKCNTKWAPQDKVSNPLGVEVVELDAQYRERFKLDSNTTGVVVVGILPSAKYSLGLREGDIITDLNGKVIHGVEDFKVAAEALPEGRAIAIRVIRGGHSGFLTFRKNK